MRKIKNFVPRFLFELRSRNKARGFALIYVLLFTTFIGLTVLITWSSGMSEIRLTRKGEVLSQAYQYALDAIEKGFQRYKSELSGGQCESVFDYALFQENKARLLKEVTDNYTRSGSTIYGNARFKGEYDENNEVWEQNFPGYSPNPPYSMEGVPSVSIEGWLITEQHIDHESTLAGFASSHYAARYNTFFDSSNEDDPGPGPFDLASQVTDYLIRESVDLPNLIYDTNPANDPWDTTDKLDIWEVGNPIYTKATTYGTSGGSIKQLNEGILETKVSGGIYNGYLYLAGTEAEPIVIDGPVIIKNDLIIKGKIKGKGSIYVGGNIYVADDITYVNPPDFNLGAYPYMQTLIDIDTFNNNVDTWVEDNTNADMVGFLAQGNIVLGDITSDWMEQYYGVYYYDDEDGNPVEDWGILMRGPYGASGFWEGGGSPLIGTRGDARASEDTGPDKAFGTKGGDYDYVGYSDPTDSDAVKQDYEDRDNNGLWRTDAKYSFQNDMRPNFDLVINYGLPDGTVYSDIANFPARIDGFYFTEHVIGGWILNNIDSAANGGLPLNSLEINGGLVSQENALFPIEIMPAQAGDLPIVTFPTNINDGGGELEGEWPTLSFKIKYDHRFKGKYINIFPDVYLPGGSAAGGAPTPVDLEIPDQTGVVDPSDPKVLRYKITNDLLEANLKTSIGTDVYDFRVINDIIYGNGYSKGNKISLWAKVGHEGEFNPNTCPPQDRSTDFIIIYQGSP